MWDVVRFPNSSLLFSTSCPAFLPGGPIDTETSSLHQRQCSTIDFKRSDLWINHSYHPSVSASDQILIHVSYTKHRQRLSCRRQSGTTDSISFIDCHLQNVDG
jgi:hypothetical protein